MSLEELRPPDSVILAVAHVNYLIEGWKLVRRLLKNEGGFVLDVKSRLDRSQKPNGIDLWRL
jgi:UDP-N-acetyl-D-galactosamine dehydrogenase